MASYKYTKGLNVNALLSLDPERLMQMDTKELREVVSRLSATANKRLKRKSNTSPIVVRTRESGNFTTKGKDIVALRNEYLRAKAFLEDRTSTVTGWKAAQSDLSKELKKAGWEVKSKDIPALLDKFNRLISAEGIDLTRGERYKYSRELSELVVDANARDIRTSQDILDSLATALQNLGYEVGEESDSRTFEDGISQFFELQ